MFRFTFFILALTCEAFFSTTAQGSDAVSDFLGNPVGLWRTYDADGKIESIVRIREENSLLYATVVKVLASEAKDGDNTRCTWCKGKQKNRPLVGMTIMGEMEKDDSVWSGGWIFDPKRDLVTKCRIELIDGGKKLKVRGYLTFFLGETRYWHRIYQE